MSNTHKKVDKIDMFNNSKSKCPLYPLYNEQGNWQSQSQISSNGPVRKACCRVKASFLKPLTL